MRPRSGLEQYLEGEAQRTVQRTFPGGTARWGISRSMFREGGLPHQLLVVTDLTRPLREEELKAWQRLVRVLGHELNNSLAPIKSIAGSLESISGAAIPGPTTGRRHAPRPGRDRRAQRSPQPLHERLCALAKLPPPTLAPVAIGELVRRVAGLETRLRPAVAPGPEITDPGRCRSAGAIADQRDSQCRGRLARDRRRRRGGLEARRIRTSDGVGARRRPRPFEYRPICSCRSSPPSRAGRASGWS